MMNTGISMMRMKKRTKKTIILYENSRVSKRNLGYGGSIPPTLFLLIMISMVLIPTV